MFIEKIPYQLGKPNFDGFPRMCVVEQAFEDVYVEDIDQSVREEINKLQLPDLSGKRVAITAGSRGIGNAMEIVRAIGNELKIRGALPFVVPAMGSHGNATSEGQAELLASYGIIERNVQMPVLSSMETVPLGVSKSGANVYCDKNAYGADYIVVCGRVKPHTDFRGPVESGLCKMMVVGLGKCDGATAFHKTGTGDMGTRLRAAADVFLSKANVLFGMAIIDNPYHRTKRLEAVLPANIMTREPELLKEATRSMARLCFDEIDVLVVDYFGKDISGCGIDPNVTGRFFYAVETVFEGYPQIKKIVLMRQTEAGHGNASGFGVADFITLKFAQVLDLGSTYTNCLQSRYCVSAKIPTIMNNDLDAIYAAASGCGISNIKDVKIVRIKNTLELGRIRVSENLLPEIEKGGNLRVLKDAEEMKFDAEDNLADLA